MAGTLEHGHPSAQPFNVSNAFIVLYLMQFRNDAQMNFRQIRTFVAVADAGGFSRATGRINLSQSAASRQIIALEAELGVQLFDRVGRRMHLTSEGEDLLQRGR